MLCSHRGRATRGMQGGSSAPAARTRGEQLSAPAACMRREQPTAPLQLECAGSCTSARPSAGHCRLGLVAVTWLLVSRTLKCRGDCLGAALPARNRQKACVMNEGEPETESKPRGQT